MSYDLMVFAADAPPADRDGFMQWYFQQIEWSEGHRYDNPDGSDASVRRWFFEMIEFFPPMNGPFAGDDVDDPRVSDYCVGKSVVYVGFAWSIADDAYRTTFALARKHGLGFFDVSADDGQVWMPDPQSDSFVCVHGSGVSRH